MSRTTRIAALVAALVLALTALTACSDDGKDDSSTDSNAPFNDADVAFATDMIPHHAQALSMVDLTRGRPLDPQVEDLVQQILDAQAPEIETMKGWLDDWGKEIPATSRDHAHADMDDMGGMDGMGGSDDMPGMMSAGQMRDLENAGDAEFQEKWLRAMITHHRGAIEMAQTEVSQGKYRDAIALAQHVADSQQAEIDTMEQLLEQ